MQWQIRILMITVAIVALLLGLVFHVQSVGREAEDLAPAILMIEGVLVAVPLATVSIVGLAVHLGKNKTYAALRRCNDVPNQSPWVRAQTSSLVQKGPPS